MRIKVEWYNEAKNIIVQRYPEQWTWDEFKRLQHIVPLMMQEVTHTVHVIGDFSQHQFLPPGNPIPRSYDLISSYPANFGVQVIVTRTGIIESYTRAFICIFRNGPGNRVCIVNRPNQVLKAIQGFEVGY